MDFTNMILTDGDELIVPAGIHTITEPIRICGSHITVRGEDGAQLCALRSLTGHEWMEAGKGILCTDIDPDTEADALYIGKNKYRMARYPKYTSEDSIFGGYAADCTDPVKTSGWRDPDGGYIHAMHKHMWGGYSYKITGKQADGSLSLTGGWQNNRQMGMHDRFRYAENIFEELTEPGEWYFDEKNHRVYVVLLPGDDPAKAQIAVSHCFFHLENASHVRIENLSLSRSSRTFMQTKEPLLRSDWTVFRGGAILISDSSDCEIDLCRFDDIGSNAIFVSGNCENVAITRCHIRDVGASGVCFVGKPESVRNPLFEYGQTLPLAVLDRTPGPCSDDYVRNCRVEECLISRTGLVEKQSAGIQISMASRITVKNCTVCHVPRAGINISEGTFGGHLIEGCDVFDTVRETGDHGSFNSWGRDRFWHVEGLDADDIHRLALLDCIEPTVIRRSRWRCDHGWDIDLDDGSSNYRIEQNLCLSGGIKLREGFHRHVKGNITVNNTVHFHVWYPHSADTVEGNLVFAPWAPIGMPDSWGECVNGNLLHTAGIPSPTPAEPLRSRSGQDADSLMLDCGFALTEDGDFSLPASGPLSAFADFPRTFGVRYEPLRVIADMPKIPPVKRSDSGQAKVLRRYGAAMRNILSDGEMSVYGTAGHNGVLVLEIEAGSAAEAFSLQKDDVIIEIDGLATDSIEQLPPQIFQSVTVLRAQHRITLTR